MAAVMDSIFGNLINSFAERYLGPTVAERFLQTQIEDHGWPFLIETRNDFFEILHADTRDVIGLIDKHTGEVVRGFSELNQELAVSISELRGEVAGVVKSFRYLSQEITVSINRGVDITLTIVAAFFAMAVRLFFYFFCFDEIWYSTVNASTQFCILALFARLLLMIFKSPPNREPAHIETGNDGNLPPPYQPNSPLGKNNIADAADFGTPEGKAASRVMADLDEDYKLSLFIDTWTRMKEEAKLISDQKSQTVGVLGGAGVGKSKTLCELFLEGEAQPFCRSINDNEEDVDTSVSVGISLFRSRLVNNHQEVITFLDVEGENGTGQQRSGIVNMLGRATNRLARAVNGNDENYVARRQEAVKALVTRFVYLMSDVVVSIGLDSRTHSSHSNQAKQLMRIASGDRFVAPVLIMIQNKSEVRECTTHGIGGRRVLAPIDQQTKAYLDQHDSDRSLRQNFSKIYFITMPNFSERKVGGFDPQEGFQQRIVELKCLLLRSLQEQQDIRKNKHTLFSPTMWHKVFEEALKHFDDDTIHVGTILEMLRSRESEGLKRLIGIIRRSASLKFCTHQKHSTHDPQERVRRYKAGFRLTLSSLATGIVTRSRLLGLELSSGGAILDSDDTKDQFTRCFDLLWQMAPCSHLYNGKRSTNPKALKKKVYCQGTRNHDMQAHHSTTLVFGSHTNDNFWNTIGYGIGWIFSAWGRPATWTNERNEEGATFMPASPETDDAYQSELASEWGIFQRKILALAGTSSKEQYHLAALQQQATALQCDSLYRTVRSDNDTTDNYPFCLGCMRQFDGRVVAASQPQCGHLLCRDCKKEAEKIRRGECFFCR